MSHLINCLKDILTVVGIGIILHYYAFVIAWGVRKGNAKISSNITINLNQKEAPTPNTQDDE